MKDYSYHLLLEIIYIKLATLVKGDPKAPFSIASTPRCREGYYSFPELLHFTLDTYLITLSVKQDGIKYHFLSLWYDSTWDWTPVSWIIGKSRDELIRDVLLWIPSHGRAKAGRPARTYIQQLCEDTGCCPEDLPRAMNDREEWRKRVRDIRATSTIW